MYPMNSKNLISSLFIEDVLISAYIKLTGFAFDATFRYEKFWCAGMSGSTLTNSRFIGEFYVLSTI